MGAKTWMLVYSNGDPSASLKENTSLDKKATARLIEKLFPEEKLESIEAGNLSYTNPPDDVIYAGCFGDVSVIAAKEFAGDYPSKVDSRFIDTSLGKVIHLHAMHSSVDWFAFAKWENGRLIRALSLSPETDVLEDIGERLEFEVDYWEGKYPAVDPEDEEDEYPFVFHPLDLGEAALKSFFGYQLEGCADNLLLEAEEISLLGYRRLGAKPWWKIL